MVLGQGQYIWTNNPVLTELTAVVDVARMQANKTTKTYPESKRFFKAEQTSQWKKCPASIPFLNIDRDWDIAVDLKGQGWYPAVACASGLRPEIVLHDVAGGVARTDGPLGVKDPTAACIQVGEI